MSNSTSSSAQPNTAQSASGAPSSTSGTPASRSSYANATKGKPSGAPPIASSTGPAIVGGQSHHGKSNSASPVNGRPTPPALPVGAPPIVSSGSIANGSTNPAEQERKPSSVTISAQGTSGYLANGGSGGQASRPNIHFGSMPASGSPAPAHSLPHNPHSSSNLETPVNNQQPQARSPSPIPQPPMVSGGRPPSAPQGQSSQLSFGNLASSDSADQSHRPSQLPTGPASLANPHHLRRDSSHSQQSDMSGPMNRNYVPTNGRGRGYTPTYPGPNIQHQQQGFRGSPAMQPRNLSNVPSFTPQGAMRGAGSPFPAARSPAIPTAAMHQPHLANGQPIPHPYGYPQHLNPQNSGIYGVPPQDFYPGYYGQPYMAPGMQQMPYGAPSSPRFAAAAHGPHPGYMAGAYQPNNLTRTPSQPGSEPRAPSTGPQAQTPSISAAQPPPVVSSSPAPASRPERQKSKAIVIKNADGEIVDLKNLKSQSPSPAPSRPPPVVSSGAGVPSATPPPRPTTAEIPPPQHTRSESQNPKSSEETKRQFTEQFKRQLQEVGKKDDDDSKPEEATKAAEVTSSEKAEQPIAEAEKEVEVPVKPTNSEETESAKKQDEEDDDEAWIRELEEQERLEEERERQYQEKKKREKAEKEAKEKEATEKADEELKRQEREAEQREEAKLKGTTTEESVEAKAEREKLFSSLKRPTLGPGASTSGTSTPTSEPMAPPPAPTPSSSTPTTKAPLPSRPKPSMLKLETGKVVEPAQPTAGMQSLRSARFLKIQASDNIYPEGVRSPNPALNQGTKSRGRQYDMDFLMQFQEVFKEKPSVDWDKMLKETVGDSSDSARPQSARTPSMGGRQNSRSAAPAMGSFTVGSRTLPPGSTSEQRFAASNSAGRMSGSFNTNPLAGYVPTGRGGMGFPMVAPPMSRTGSTQSRGPQNLNSPRTGSARGGSRRDKTNAAQEAQMAKTMPLTAGKDLKPLEVSKSGWKPTSIGSNQPLPSGHITPDVVQRKVKSALNKMTPEKFDKISLDILQIAAQSKDESDGRTLRQVIQLTFEKACDEAYWASMYAKFCKRMMETMSHDIKDENVKDKNSNPVVGGALFRKYLLNRCQEEFERGWEVNLPTKPEGQTEEAAMLSEEYYIAAAAKRRGLGLIQFIGELYKLGMLTIRIMHECVFKLLNFQGLPEETTVESLVKLLQTIGATMEGVDNGREMLNMYFERIDTIMKTSGLPSRMYYMLLDTVEMRKKGWETKNADKGPKTIAEIHDEAARKAAAAEIERQKQVRAGGRPPAGRGDARSFSTNMGAPPPDYSRNTVGMDDLKKLARGVRANQSSGASLGPSSMLSGSRSGSRRGLGPPRTDDSGPASRTGTPPVKDKESTAHVNAFSVLADTGDGDNDVTSPPAVSPALPKSTLATKSGDEQAS